MKQLLDFFPLAVFAGAYYFTKDIFLATLLLIGASALQLSIDYIRVRKVDKMHFYLFLVLLVFGGMTILLRDDTFIKWKPTVVNWVFALVFLGSHFIGEKPLVQRLLEGMLKQTPHLELRVPSDKWAPINMSWVVFFLSLGAINWYVAFHFEEEVWVTFKFIGMTTLNIGFMIAQFVYLSRFMVEVAHKEPGSPTETETNKLKE